MHAQVAKWGNSLAVRIPKAVARETGLTQGATVQMTTANGGLLIIPAERRYGLKELVSGITRQNRHAETDWGGPVGQEVW
jgi:antitoxin MazE